VINISKKGRTSRKVKKSDKRMSERKKLKLKPEYNKGPKKKSFRQNYEPHIENNNSSLLPHAVSNNYSNVSNKYYNHNSGWAPSSRFPQGFDNGLVFRLNLPYNQLTNLTLKTNQPLHIEMRPEGIVSSLFTIIGFNQKNNGAYYAKNILDTEFYKDIHINTNSYFFKQANKSFSIASRLYDSLINELEDLVKSSSGNEEACLRCVSRNRINYQSKLDEATFFEKNLNDIYYVSSMKDIVQPCLLSSVTYQKKVDQVRDIIKDVKKV
jgi:hypothetical protein